MDHLSDISCQDIYNAAVLPEDEYRSLCRRKPASFREKMDIISAVHNSYSKRGENEKAISFPEIAEEPLFLTSPIYTRDDGYDLLRALYEDDDRADLDARKLWKGAFRNGRHTLGTEAPDTLKELAQCTRYLFPRVFGQWRMLQYMRLAKYLKPDRRAYCKTVWGKAQT